MRFIRTAGVLLTITLGIAACASTDEVSTETVDDPTPVAPADPAAPQAPPAAAPNGEVGPPSQPAAPADVPDVDVARIPSGDTVNLQTLAQGNDTLFWFWAPH